MADKHDGDRHSHALSPELVTDPNEKAILEARNGLRQFDITIELIDDWLKNERAFKIRTSTVLQLHRVALEGLSSFAGNFRPAGVEIKGSKHEPIGAHQVPEYIEEMCDYINDNWETESGLHLASYAMWRLNWVHPFDDGNGRTARALSYLVLCIKLRCQLPGVNTIPEQISRSKKPYYEALEAADEAFKKGKIDLTDLEKYLGGLLAEQLVSVYNSAQNSSDDEMNNNPKFH